MASRKSASVRTTGKKRVAARRATAKHASAKHASAKRGAARRGGHIGIRLEDKNEWERRVPLTPDQVQELIRRLGMRVTVQSSPVRAFGDGSYRDAGATVAARIDGCPVVFAVKEVPKEFLRKGRTYVFFSHTTKGQQHNMPLLRRLMDLKCTLIDYEKIVDDAGRRLIFFGFHAGLAGMIESLWALGQRWKALGHETPFARVKHAYDYTDLADVREQLLAVGHEIRTTGLPARLAPMVVGFAGYGNVSRGAQDVLTTLPLVEVTPEELLGSWRKRDRSRDRHVVYKVVFKEEHMARPEKRSAPFVLKDYYDHPEDYRAAFEPYLAHLSVLVNCIYWTQRYPRLVTCDWVEDAWDDGRQPRLTVIGDISCDVLGAIECTVESTEPGAPVFVYDVEKGKAVLGVRGHGPVVLAVDNLPCELPRESSAGFGQALMPYVPAIADADYTVPFEDLALPPPIKRAVIVYRGELTASYTYLHEHLAKR